jgi:spore maturation protein A
MNRIWTVLLLAGIGTLLFIDPNAALSAMTKGSHDAVKLAMSLVALYAFWLGFLAVLEKTGIAGRLAKILRPLVNFLFPGLKGDSGKLLTMNMSANMLGLGNAATPMAIDAIKSMETGAENGRATVNMIMLTVISATSLQLLPSTVISLRAAHGSAHPADFLAASTAATVISTVLGILLVKIYAKFRKKKEAKKAAAAPLPLMPPGFGKR